MSRIIITDKGEISLESSSKVYINPSPIGILVCGGIAHKPASAEVCGEDAVEHSAVFKIADIYNFFFCIVEVHCCFSVSFNGDVNYTT